MARSFNGSSDFIALPFAVTDAINNGTAVSISCWFNGSDATSCVRLQPNASDYILLVWNTTQSIISTDGGPGGALNWGAGINDGNWHRLTLTWATNATFALYKDASVVDSRAAANVVLPAFSSHVFNPSLGDFNGGPSEFTNGKVADVSIWNVVLTAGEIGSLAGGVRPYNIRRASLLSYWPLDGIQSPEPDLSGFANNGTLTGTGAATGPPINMFTPHWPINTDVVAAATAGLGALLSSERSRLVGSGLVLS